MLPQIGHSADDDAQETHLLGSSQGQSDYAASLSTTSPLQETQPSNAAPHQHDTTAYYTYPSWPAIDCINPAYLDWALSTGPGHLGFGSPLHLGPLSHPVTGNCTFSCATSPQALSGLSDTLSYHQFSPLTVPRPQAIIGHKPESARAHIKSNTPAIKSSGMQSPPYEYKTLDVCSLYKSSHLTTSSIASRKRSQQLAMDDQSGPADRMEPPTKIVRTGQSPQKRKVVKSLDNLIPFRDVSIHGEHQNGVEENEKTVNPDPNSLGDLNGKQKKFIRQWYNDFAKSGSQSHFSNESISALSTLIQARPQLIFEYIKKTYPYIADARMSTTLSHLDSITSEEHRQPPHSPAEPDTIASANAHLPPVTLSLVTKYIVTSRRLRSANDGRRSVNTGPLRCTFGCVYRTRRAFDWKRHEETHEPQELYLCTLCPQNEKKEPFLVSRKDKFLKHVREVHKEWIPEQVLDLSKLDYRPSIDLGCPFCPWRGVKGKEGWEERCKHVLEHFDDEVAQDLKRVRLVREEDEAKPGAVGSAASTSVTSDDGIDDTKNPSSNHID